MPRADAKQKEVIRTCVSCGYTDTEWKFPLQNIQFGRAYYRKECKPCYNKYQLERKAIRAGQEVEQKLATRSWPYPPED
jgi:hypothetical protein